MPLKGIPSVRGCLGSAMMAVSRGLRASNNSTTRGRPPVMSLVFVVSRGILAGTSPAWTSSPSRAIRWAWVGIRYFLASDLVPCAVSGRTITVGWRFSSGSKFITTNWLMPVTSSNCSCMVMPSSRSLKCTVPARFGQDGERVGIPLQQDLVRLDRTAVFHQDLGAVPHLIALFFAALVVDHGHDAIAVHGVGVNAIGPRRVCIPILILRDSHSTWDPSEEVFDGPRQTAGSFSGRALV